MTVNSHIAKPALSRIDELDGLRGILALWVALIHIVAWCGMAPHAFPVPAIVKRFFDESSQGAVDVFIILSGFVITYLLGSRRQSYRQFMTGRFFRIYPVYLFCLLLGFSTIHFASSLLMHAPWHETPYFQEWLTPTVTAQAASPISHLLAHLTLLFGVIPEKMMPSASGTLLGPAWSITLEWQYYLLAPLLARLIFFRAGLLLLGLVGASGFFLSRYWSGSFLPVQLPLFLVGIGSYNLYRNAYRWRAVPDRVALAAVIIIAAVITISWHWMALTVWSLVLGCLFLNEDAGQSHDFIRRRLGGLRRMLLRPALQWLGKISYPIYLVHWPVIIFLLVGLLHLQPEITPAAALTTLLVVGLPVIIFASWLLHKLVEKPLMQFGRKFTK